MKKRLNKISKIAFNVLAVTFGLTMVGSAIAFEQEGSVTALFGGYKTIVGKKDENLVEDPETLQYYKSDYNSVAEVMAAGRQKCAEIEEEGAVLLKNEDALPLGTGSKVALFGTTATNPVYAGSGSGGVNASTAVNYLDSLKAEGISVNEALYDEYKKSSYNIPYNTGVGAWTKISEAPFTSISETNRENAEYGDAAIYVVGRVGGENIDLARSKTTANKFNPGNDFKDGNYLQLNDTERTTLTELKKLKDKGVYKKIIVILNTANQVEADFIEREEYGVDAALWVGDVGSAGLNGVARIISGKVNPSGRLSETFWNKHYYNPVLANFGMYSYGTQKMASSSSVTENYVAYQEGIYVGYRYVETRYADVTEGRKNAGDFDYDQVVAYPFGYGLSYTDFTYSDFKVTEPAIGSTEYTVNVTVKNTGDTDGKEAVQIYLQKPYTDYDIQNHVEKSAIELVGYTKTPVIKAGAEYTATVKVDKKFLTSYDAYGAGTYILDAGEYTFAVGHNVHDALDNILTGNGRYTKSFRQLNLDKETYSKTEDKKEIVNLFDHADLNRYDGADGQSISYISRNDWKGTVKLGINESGDDLAANVAIKKTAKMTEDQKIDADGAMEKDDRKYPTYGATKVFDLIDLRVDADGKEISYDDKNWETLLDQLTWDETVELLRNGLRMTASVDSITKKVTKEHNGPCGVVGGNSYTYGDADNNRGLAVTTDDPDKGKSPTCYPCNGIVAATFNDELAKEMGEMIGEDALWAGYHGLYGTGLNIRRTAYQGRAFEYYSEDALLTGYLAGSECEGIQSKGCYVYNKHFVLNEQETNRNGICTWANEQTIRENYLRAFEIAIKDYGAYNVMTAFNRLGVIWSGMDKNLCTEYLRNEAGMKGFAVSDWYDSRYMGLGAGILAGNDLPDGTREASELNKYKTGYGELAWAMRESVHRILYTVVHSSAMNGISSNTVITTLKPTWIGVLKGVRTTVCVLFGLGTAFFVATEVMLKLEEKKNRQEESK